MIIFCYRWRLFTIFAKREWLFWPAWAGGVKNHIFGAFTLKVDIKQIFFKSNLFKSLQHRSDTHNLLFSNALRHPLTPGQIFGLFTVKPLARVI